MFNYSKLRGRIKEKYGSEKAFALKLAISQSSLSQKLNGLIDFSMSEVESCIDFLEIQEHELKPYFFTKTVQYIELERKSNESDF